MEKSNNIKSVTYYDFVETICKDNNISNTTTDILTLPNDESKIKSFVKGHAHIINFVTKSGERLPYMVNTANGAKRNEKFSEASILELKRSKRIYEVSEELGIVIKSKSCRISEGGGWYSNGTAYYYKDIRCEV